MAGGREGARLMLRLTVTACLFACPLFWANSAFADSAPIAISINAGPLPAGLQSLERVTGIELLFDSGLVSGLQSPAVQGQLTPEEALKQLVAGKNLAIRRAQSGAWIVERPAAAPLAQQDVPVTEILVIGRRTQNADIRRTEDD